MTYLQTKLQLYRYSQNYIIRQTSKALTSLDIYHTSFSCLFLSAQGRRTVSGTLP